MTKLQMKKHMKGLCLATACAALGAGCMKSEAERFGYKGADLEDQESKTFLALSPTVTNWVPERVITIYEKYDWTQDELGVVKAAGVLMPCQPYPSFPEGFKETTKEPWFSLWTKDVKSFGLDGVTGILAHYNADRKVWETGESYFSSYWKTKDEALKALALIEKQLAASHNVKKFHKFTDCWVAEYVRLRVTGVVGQKADGTWSCMLDIRDKNSYGCGAWEPVEDQQARLNRYIYAKEMRAWKAEMAKIWAKNTETIAARAKERNLPGFEGATEQTESEEDARKMRILSGMKENFPSNVVLQAAIAELWTNKVQLIEKSVGAKLTEEPAKESAGTTEQWWHAEWKTDLYEIRLDVAMFVPSAEMIQKACEKEKACEQAEGEEEACAMPPPKPSARWRIICRDVLLPGTVFPKKPQLKK